MEVRPLNAQVLKGLSSPVLHKQGKPKRAQVRRNGQDRIAQDVSWPQDLPTKDSLKVNGVKRALGKLLVDALSISAKRGLKRVALELFSGTGRIGQSLDKLGIGCVCIDIKFGPSHDLTRQVVQSVITGWITSGLILCIWACLATVGVEPGTISMGEVRAVQSTFGGNPFCLLLTL